ncbi:MAG TPA: metalloregulator ArsR/SmtB family transcription factor [Burkholderiaceae bacterium]|nr:metalloregulator ArsR/SmtB family transcription factor [Burkholderiaceae bacterium]
MDHLPPEALSQVAAYFQALAEPTRLQILNLMRTQQRSVGELAELTGFSSANVSRHLSFMAQHGLVARESRGNSAIYRIADPAIYELCDLVCGSIARKHERAAAAASPFIRPDAAAQSASRPSSKAASRPAAKPARKRTAGV